MSEATAIAQLQQFAAELNQGNMESVRQYLAAGYFNNMPGEGEPKAYDVYFKLLSDIKAAMPDLYFQIADLQSNGELITGALTVSGTTDGPLWGVPPTNKPFSWTVNVSIRPINGRFAVNIDDVTVPGVIATLREIDMMPPPDRMDKPHKYPVQVPEPILQALFNGGMAEKPCDHLPDIQVFETDVDVCPQCVASGDIWPALRMCLICGFVGCCDTSKNKHAKQHYEESGHPLIRSIRLDESWGWCYEHNTLLTTSRLKKHYPRGS